MSGTFSTQLSPSSNDAIDIPFYNAEYEDSLWSGAGLGESVSPTPGALFDMSGLQLNDPCYFLDFAEESEPLQEDTGYFEYNTLSPFPSAEVKPEVKEPVKAVRKQRYEPYSEPSSQDKKRRGRPMKSSSGSGSKMATYSRQYREMKKNQLATSEVKIQKLEEENADLRAQMDKMNVYMQKLEAELKRLKRRPVVNQSVPAVVAVDQRY